MLRVGYSGMLPREAPHYAAFEKRMAELGYQEGRNFTFGYIQAPSIRIRVLHSPVNRGVQVTPVENNKAIPNQPRRNRQTEVSSLLFVTKQRRMPPYQRPG
jgi:hypothetical protein